MHSSSLLRGLWVGLFVVGLAVPAAAQDATREADPDIRPSFVVIFCDDLGYGDLGCFGHPTIRTPQLDRMAAEGTKLTSCYVAAPICTPSRAALLTGRLPIRNGLTGKRGVYFPDSSEGLPQSETTVATLLHDSGYATGMVGKWHLGHLPEFLPTSHGFDEYAGIPYSNDMSRADGYSNKSADPFATLDWRKFNVPLVQSQRGEDGQTAAASVLEQPTDQTTITERYTQRAVEYIERHAPGARSGEQPFFLYVAHSLPHIPLFRSDAFAGQSAGGVYGDVIEEIDQSVGRILDAIRVQQLGPHTTVLFTSDNGPWLPFRQHGGSAGPLRDGKGTTWEGGVRVPGIAWGRGVEAGRTTPEMFCTLDVLPTFAAMAGVEAAAPGVTLDGVDQTAFLAGGGSARDAMMYYRGRELFAVRRGPWKAHFITQGRYSKSPAREEHDPPLLFHLGIDPGEQFNVAGDHPDVVADLTAMAEQFVASFDPPPSRMEGRLSEADQQKTTAELLADRLGE